MLKGLVLGLLSLMMCACATDDGTTDRGAVDFTITGQPAMHAAATPGVLGGSVLTIHGDEVSGVTVRVFVLNQPGSYDCATSDPAKLTVEVLRKLSSGSDDAGANQLQPDSRCTVAWTSSDGRDIGDFTAHAESLDHPGSFVDVTGHFDVPVPKP